MRGRILPTMALVGAYLFGSQASAQQVSQVTYPTSQSSVYVCDRAEQTDLVNDSNALEIIAQGLAPSCIRPHGDKKEDCIYSSADEWKSSLRNTLSRTLEVKYDGSANTVTFTSARGSSSVTTPADSMKLILSAVAKCNLN